MLGPNNVQKRHGRKLICPFLTKSQANSGANKRYVFLITLLVVAAFGCDVPERPRLIAISKPPAFRPSTPNQVQNVEQAMAAIITVCRDDLGLPAVDPIFVHLYKNTASFSFYGSGWRTLPFDVASLPASANENKIHVNLEKMRGESWGTALPLLAHEYAHNVHYALTDGRLRGTRWFAEGFGEWVAARVIDSLGWQSYGVTLHRARRELARHRDLVLGLSWLQDKRDWESLLQKPKGYVRTYGLAFAAVDRLIGKKGLTSAIEYIKSGDFEGSFGESQVAYKTDLGSSGPRVEQPQRSDFAIRKPEWKIGYQWIYQERLPGMKKTLRKQMIKEDFIHNMPVFVVKVDNEEEFYTKETLGLIATKKNDKLSTQRDKPNEFFAWPLEAAKEWRNTYTIKVSENKETGVIDRLMVVPNMEEVTVPAGTFQAAKIEAYDNKSGRLDAEYWYSPIAKWFVRSINYGVEDGFAREQELVSFKIE